MGSLIANWIYGALLASVGGYLTLRGFDLLVLGGSWYYLLAGLALLVTVGLLLRRHPWSALAYAAIVFVTVIWAAYEAGLDFLPLLARLGAWMVVGLWFLAPWYRAAMRRGKDPAPRTYGLWTGGAILTALALLIISGLQSYPVAPFERTAVASLETAADWRHYGNTPEGTRFSPLDEITRENVAALEEVWRFRTGIPYEFKNTPLQIGEMLYMCTAGNRVIAVDAATGTERWRYNPQNTLTGGTVEDLADDNMFSRTCRGLSYYASDTDTPGSCPARILTATTDARLIALDAGTGQPCADFGTDGAVDLRAGFHPHHPLAYMVTSVPLIAGRMVVVGGWVIDNQELGNVSGTVRAYDAVTGAFAWAWDMGNPDDSTLPDEGAYFTRGTPNVWSTMSYDPDRDLVFLPTGNASPDYFGGKRRRFDEEYASSVIALRASTGELIWSFQTVHHDIWDYDVPSQPTLLDITKDDRRIPVVLVPTKRGEIFVLDRRDGTPVYPATVCPDGSPAAQGGECPVPQDPTEGDTVSPTQPFSALPHFRPDRLERDMWGLTPLDHLHCRIDYKKMRYEGHFTPPMPGGGTDDMPRWGGTFQFPGNTGGFNWPSVSVDPDHGLLIAQPIMLGNRLVMMTAEEMAARFDDDDTAASDDQHGADLSSPEQTPEERARQARARSFEQFRQAARPDPAYRDQGPWKPGLRRYANTRVFTSTWKIPLLGLSTNLPCFEPPYARLAVIDLNSNQMLWSRAFGTFGPGRAAAIGLPAIGGTMTTRGGLIFQLGTVDASFTAVDITNGHTLWSATLPRSSSATPISYRVHGRQMIAVTVPASPMSEDDDGQGGWVIAYALPKAARP